MTDRHLKVLCLGYCFPPISSPESFVFAKTMGAIPAATVDVITSVHQLHLQPPDRSLDSYVAARFGRVERIDGWLYRMLGKIERLPIRPDRYLAITHKCLALAESLNLRSYDVIVTRSQYHSVHAAGRRLKRRHPDIPWIASFSDPWSASIFQREIPIISRWSRHLERAALKEADALVFPTAEMRDHVKKQHPDVTFGERCHVISHGFDPELITRAQREPGSRPVHLGMFGTFYGPRSPKLLLEAIGRLASNPAMPDFTVHFYGPESSEFTEKLKGDPAAAACVEHKGTLPHTDALRAMEDYDILITVDAPTPEPSIFLSSKVVDYLGTDRPIFAVTPKGATLDLVNRAGGWTVSPRDAEAVASSLGEAIRSVNAQQMPIDVSVREEYRIDRVGQKFRAVIDSLLAKD